MNSDRKSNMFILYVKKEHRASEKAMNLVKKGSKVLIQDVNKLKQPLPKWLNGIPLLYQYRTRQVFRGTLCFSVLFQYSEFLHHHQTPSRRDDRRDNRRQDEREDRHEVQQAHQMMVQEARQEVAQHAVAQQAAVVQQPVAQQPVAQIVIPETPQIRIQETPVEPVVPVVVQPVVVPVEVSPPPPIVTAQDVEDSTEYEDHESSAFEEEFWGDNKSPTPPVVLRAAPVVAPVVARPPPVKPHANPRVKPAAAVV